MSSRPIAAARRFAEIAIGETITFERAFSASEVQRFAEISGDFSPLHVDPEYAATTEFRQCVVHGLLLGSLFSQLVGMHLPGRPALYLGQDLTFRRPVLVGEKVTALGKVISKSEPTQSIAIATEIRGADGKIAVSGTARVKVRDNIPHEAAYADGEARLAADRTRRVALVTGASRGIGAEIARELGRGGYCVAVNYFRSPGRAAVVVDEIRATGGEAFAVEGDVRDLESVARMVAAVQQTAGSPSVLVNVATGELQQRPLADLCWDDFVAQLEYQVKACFLTAQAVRAFMRELGGGSIVNVLSQVTGGVPPARMSDYVTAKYALEGLSKTQAVEYAEDGIRVNMVSPGLVQTDLTQFHPDRVFRMEALKTPLRRIATPLDVARSVAFLLDDHASFVTGMNLFVSGGQVMP